MPLGVARRIYAAKLKIIFILTGIAIFKTETPCTVWI